MISYTTTKTKDKLKKKQKIETTLPIAICTNSKRLYTMHECLFWNDLV